MPRNCLKATAMKKLSLFISLMLALCAQGQQSITLVQPTAGSTWEGARTYTITWEAQNINLIKIEFSANGGTSWQLVEAAYPATAFSYAWTVPEQPTDSAQIRLSDSENPAIYSVSGLFTIPYPEINIELISNLRAGQPYTLFWESISIAEIGLLFSNNNTLSWDTVNRNVNAQLGLKNWAVPEAADTCLIKLFDESNPEVFSISNVFTITEMPEGNVAKFRGGSYDGYARYSNLNPALQITYPAGGETLEGGTLQTLKWDATNIAQIMILFSLDGGDNWHDTIYQSYPAEALSIDYALPNIPTEAAQFKIISISPEGYEAVSGTFTILEPFVEITNTFPELKSGTPYPVFWESQSVNFVSVAYSSDGGANYDLLKEFIPAENNVYNLHVPAPTDVARIKIWDAELPDIFDESEVFAISSLQDPNPAKYHGGSYDGYAKLSNTGTQLELLYPVGGESIEGGDEIVISWNAENINQVMLLYSDDGGENWPDTLTTAYPAGALSFPWTIPNTPTQEARIKIGSVDYPDLESESDNFIILDFYIGIQNSFELLLSGTPQPVFWESTSINFVSVAYSADAGQNYTTLKTNMPASNQVYNYSVPEPTTQGKIKIWDSENPETYDETELFMIATLPEANTAKYHGGSYDGYAMSVFQVAEFGCPPDTALCEDEPAFEPMATPPGGIFSGTGMVAGAFDPTTAGPGTHEITYTYTYFNGSSTSCTFFITVYPMPEVNCPASLDVCIDAPAFELLGGSPLNGTYAGPGVEAGTFHPAVAGIGAHSIQYNFTSGEGCTETCSFAITVHELPELTCPENMEVCEDVESLALPQATPAGGIYSGTTVENGIFYPAEAGPGTYTITYSYTDEFLCSNTCQFEITVHPLPEMVCPGDVEVCIDAEPFELQEGEPGNGSFSGAGVDNITFYPEDAGIGTHEILYSFTDQNGCFNSCAFFVSVHPLPEMTCPGNIEMCVNDSPVVLSGALPAGGVYAGLGVSEGVFDPALAGEGTHQIIYTFTNENTCTNQCAFEIAVHPLPQMVCPDDFEMCIDEAPVLLESAQPAGGSYAGSGVMDGYFNPALAGTGTHEITYTFTDENTCTNTCSFYLTVNPLPEMACPGSFALCVDAGIIELPEALPGGGEYAGNGVSGLQFNPEIAGTGTHTITYTFTDEKGCTNDCSFEITVNELPVVSCPADMEICIDHQPISLQGGNPVGGIYSGTGITDGVFYPEIAGAGNHQIGYTFADENGCVDQCDFYILVHPLPDLTCPDDVIVCIDSDPFTLENAQPEGGEYSGPGVANGSFDPQMAGTGDHEISYTYTDDNMCTAICNFVISVKPLPVVTCPGNYAVCQNDEPFALTGASPGGGVYSGTGVVDGMFDPVAAGTGIKNISYAYEDEFGCANLCTFKITVLPPPVVACPANIEVCLDETPFEIVGLSPMGGELIGNGIEGLVFDPALAGAGTHSITYSYTSPINFCTNTCEFQITVFALPEITCGAQIEVCLDDEAFSLENASPVGGIYSGTGVEDGIFNPGLAGLGTHSISYFFTDENGCASTCDFSIIVHPVPEMSCPESFGLCIYEAPLLLDVATPQGGTYFGSGIEDGVFDPELAGAGTHVIAYEYANEFGCSHSCSFEITVYPIPELSCNPPEAVCKYNGPVSLAVCSPAGGTYTGFGVAGNTFFPEIAGEGEHVISYHYTDAATSCENEVTFTMNVLPSQLVDLPMGWSGVSSFLIPVDEDITEMFADAATKLEILYNFDGTVYYPGGNLIPENPWDMYAGYCLKMSQSVEMDFCGDYLQELTVQLQQGWNLVPMLSKNPVSSDFVFGFNDNIQIVKQVAGWKVFWKEMGINTLGYVNPGKAYYVYCTAETIISYPYYDGQAFPEPKPDEVFTSPFEPVLPTPSSQIVAFTRDAAGQFRDGDIIAAFTQTGLCAGQIQVTNDRPSLVVFGDDPYSEIQDGLLAAESINYRLYRPETASYFDLQLSWDASWLSGDTFTPEGVSVVKGVKLSAVGISAIPQSSISIYPNPTTGLLHIAGIEGVYKVEVFNALQEAIFTKQLIGKDQIDLSAYPKGMYLLKITTSDFSFTEKVVVN